MNFFTFIHSIQQKPEKFRKRLLILSVIVTMMIIISLWLTIIERSLRIKGSQNKSIFFNTTADVSSPFSFLRETVTESFTKLQNQLN